MLNLKTNIHTHTHVHIQNTDTYAYILYDIWDDDEMYDAIK